MAATAFGDWCFERRGGVCSLISPQGLVLAASGGPAGSGLAGVDTLGIPQMPAAAGMRTHTMRLRFRSRGFFAAEPAAHFALGLGGAWRKTDPNAAAWNGLLAGRGAILGNVSGAPLGCAQWPVLQLESFRTNGNALIAGSGSIILAEEAWYALELSSHDEGALSYVLRDADARVLSRSHAADVSPHIPPALGGWWITHVFSDAQPQRDWCFDIADLHIEWQ